MNNGMWIKKLVLAVAGSGKTQYIIDKLGRDNNFLIITYTNNNYINIKNRIIKKFNGSFPKKYMFDDIFWIFISFLL